MLLSLYSQGLLETTVRGIPQRVLGSASYQVGKMDVLNVSFSIACSGPLRSMMSCILGRAQAWLDGGHGPWSSQWPLHWSLVQGCLTDVLFGSSIPLSLVCVFSVLLSRECGYVDWCPAVTLGNPGFVPDPAALHQQPAPSLRGGGEVGDPLGHVF